MFLLIGILIISTGILIFEDYLPKIVAYLICSAGHTHFARTKNVEIEFPDLEGHLHLARVLSHILIF